MAKTFDSKLAWVQVDVDTLTHDDRANYEAYKAAYRVMKEARVMFELGMQDQAPSGKRLVFGYNFGKLSVAMDAAQDAPKAKQGTLSLAAFLATQVQAGARA